MPLAGCFTLATGSLGSRASACSAFEVGAVQVTEAVPLSGPVVIDVSCPFGDAYCEGGTPRVPPDIVRGQ